MNYQPKNRRHAKGCVQQIFQYCFENIDYLETQETCVGNTIQQAL